VRAPRTGREIERARRSCAQSDMHFSNGERKHSIAVQLIGRVVLNYEEIDNREELAATRTTRTTTTTTVTAAAAAAAGGKEEEGAE